VAVQADTFAQVRWQHGVIRVQFRHCVFCYPRPDLLIEETPHFRVLREPYPLTAQDHRMILSREHFGCAGELPPDLMHELVSLRARLVAETEQRHGVAMVYEHGRAGTCHVGIPGDAVAPSCEHFHLHVLPSRARVQHRLVMTYRRLELRGLSEIPELFARYGDYLYVEEGRRGGALFLAGGLPVPPHHLRTLISEEIGQPQLADWEAIERSQCTSRKRVRKA
jgi:diadenosine tetraphosphate (Ap4A) HIT family hydrolase